MIETKRNGFQEMRHGRSRHFVFPLDFHFAGGQADAGLSSSEVAWPNF
jgi:hypothetical protein